MKLIFESEGYVEMNRDDIINLITSSDGDKVASRDYVDTESGEVMWEKGQRAGDTNWHEEALARAERLAKKDEIKWQAELKKMEQEDLEAKEQKEQEYDNANREFEDAIGDFLVGFGKDTVDHLNDIDVQASDAAIDLADSFFFHNNWRYWSDVLGISRQNMNDRIAEEIYEILKDNGAKG